MTNESKPVELQYSPAEEALKLIRMLVWTPFEAACHVQEIKLFDFAEFTQNPSHYPDVDDYYKIFTQPIRLRIAAGISRDQNQVIKTAEPMIWLMIAEKHGLYMGPGIGLAWQRQQGLPQKMYINPDSKSKNSKKSGILEKNHLTTLKKKKNSGRPLHEADDRYHIMDLGREINREHIREKRNLNKSQIVKIIRETYPRALIYRTTGIIKWLTQASIAFAKRGRPKSLSSISN